MNNKNAVMLAAIFVLALASTALAASVSSVTTTASTATATTGTSVVITAISTADSETVSNVQIQLVKDSGTGNGSCTGSSDFSISDPASPYYYTTSVSVSGTTKTFTFTVGVCGTYTYHVADSWSGGSKSSTSDTIEFIAPTALTVQSNVSAVQINYSQSFGLSIDITNSQGSQVTTSYALSVPSGLTASGDPTSASALNISSGSTATRTWTITHSTCFTGSKAVALQLGDNTNASYVVITGNTSCPAAPSSTTTATTDTTTTTRRVPGTNVTDYPNKHVIKIPSIAANNSAEVEITKSQETGVKKIVISVKNSVNNIEITITKADVKPAEVAVPTGTVYRYLNIAKANITDNDVDNATIDFEVERSWIAANNINASTIALSRYTATWAKLPTIETGSNATHRFYQAVSPGLSVFTITGSEIGAAPSAPEQPSPGALEQAPTAKPSDQLLQIIAAVLIIAVVLLLAIFYYHGKNVKKEIFRR